MAKYCCKCKKKIGIFSAAYPIGNQVLCRGCANDVSQANSINNNSKKTQEDFGKNNVFYSGLVLKDSIRINPGLGEVTTKEDIENNLRKINNLPEHIKNKILEVPQFEIFFENNTPYYITQNDPVKKELPRANGCYFYYDPVKDTEAYKIVIEDVKKTADKEYEDEMIKKYGTKKVLGGVHLYYVIEARILYEKYGIHCINNPMSLNRDIYID